MKDNDEKSKTLKFTPANSSQKENLDRDGKDIYSSARKTPSYSFDDPEEDSSSDKKLVYTLIILTVVVAIVIAAGIFIIKGAGTKKPQEEAPTDNEVQEETLKEEDKEETEEEKVNYYSLVFYGDSIINKGDYYTILADFYDASMKKVDNRKVIVNSETVIRENGKRITPEGLVYVVEGLAGEGIVFDCEIRESDNFAVKISYEGEFKAELGEEPEPDLTEENPVDDKETPEGAIDEEPVEENPIDGI
ncbi:MAG: hypothetical protein UIL37_01970 [Clostridia bacterium]|nr:hypothetical protein [Clostridia bacterium]